MTHGRTIRAKSPADLLALAPSLFGFYPERSVVVLTLGEAGQPVHARVDLPVDAAEGKELARQLTEVTRRHGVRSLAVLVYSDDRDQAEQLVGCLARRLRSAHVELACAVRADGRQWWLLHSGPGGRARSEGPGTPYDVDSHPLMAQAVFDGTVVHGSRRELADSLVGSDPEELEEVRALADQVLARLVPALTGPLGPDTVRHHLAVEGRWVRRRVRRFVRDGGRLDAHDVARLTALMRLSLEVRDVAWAELTRQDAARHIDLWRDVVRRSPVELRAAPAALLGFAAWVAGQGALAWCAVDSAQEAEPGYSLAGLLAELLAGAVPPSAWRPIPPEDLTLFAG